MADESSSEDADQPLAVFRRTESAGTPLTTGEVAAELACDQRTAAARLRTLVDEGALRTKPVGSQRIWWRPVDQKRPSEGPADFAPAQFQELVRAVADYAIFVLDRDGYIRTWNAGAKRLKGYDRSEVIGEHFSTFYTEEDRAAGRPAANIRKAAEHGRIEDEGKRVRNDGSTFWANVTITALRDDDDGDVRGFIKITQDMTERREYEQQLEHERERLEFINRLVRHNLLNSLNVVDARLGLIRQYADPEAYTHVETAADHTEEMIDLVEKLRALMDVLTTSKDRELERIDLGDVLRRELDRAEATFEQATYEVQGSLDDVGVVVADELLEEAFENLLSNAVQHNDTERPRITIEVERDAETTTVRIADNGPGVPNEMKETIFQRGEKRFESPGTGFGLYFVKEIVEAYGGTIDVSDNDPRGAVFSVTLPHV
ncbi:ATP-binding protein [Haloplanus halobius]|uniref:ATP-binding protein n=1 Tax=Haloplanus halobius TaxID=2934938 RepID=UPI00200CB6B5|nr:PAS domain-containing sensor histidine kinase [Haloplanus sp. XH21]